MRPGWTLAHPQVADPGIEPGDRPYGSQLGTCRVCNMSVTKGRLELPSPCGHDVLSVARLPIAPLGHVVSSPCGSRTRLASVRSWYPMPIDERAIFPVRRAGVEPANPQGMAGLRPVGLANAQSSHVVQWRRWDLNPQSPRFGHRREAVVVAALPVCVPRRSHRKRPGGIWTRDLLRDKQASTPGCSTRACWFFSGSGGGRTHSILGSKPRWSAGCLPGQSGPGWN